MLRLPPDRALEVVGVVRDVSSVTLAELDDPLIYLPFDSTLDVPANVFVRFSGDPSALAGRVTGTIKRIAPELSIRATTIQAQRDVIIATFMRLTWLIGLLALIAAALAVVGMYGVVSFAVSQRRKELGIRLALGARASDIYRAVMGSSGRPIIVALGVGAVHRDRCNGRRPNPPRHPVPRRRRSRTLFAHDPAARGAGRGGDARPRPPSDARGPTGGIAPRVIGSESILIFPIPLPSRSA
jgi:hypothetical protein